MNFTHGSLFSGIGGFDLASERMGWENKFHCEWNEFGQKILKYYWPKAESYGDITKTDFTIWRNRIDILTGGFPCQPYSLAGKRKGKDDERHLWPEMLRAIREIQPRYIVGENVPGIITWNGGLVFEEVQTDMENEGYEVWTNILPACSKDAPHKRDRVWFVAYNSNARIEGLQRSQKCNDRSKIIANSESKQGKRLSIKQSQISSEEESEFRRRSFENCGQSWAEWPTQSPICSGNDGLSSGLDNISFSKWREESIKAYGNAIVPQVAYEIFKAIEKTEKELNL